MSFPEKLPKIFYVNWFRKDENGMFIWPGYGDNIRVLAWIMARIDDRGAYVDTPIGRMPAKGALDLSGLRISPENAMKLTYVDKAAWLEEVNEMREYYKIFGDKLPKQLTEELDKIEERLKK
jgi:phosphoenolpyruvate carboxykinase (GTP)